MWMLRELRMEYCHLTGNSFSLGVLKTVLEVGSGDGSTTLWTYLIPPNCTFEHGLNGKHYALCILQKKKNGKNYNHLNKCELYLIVLVYIILVNMILNIFPCPLYIFEKCLCTYFDYFQCSCLYCWVMRVFF